MAKYFTLHAVHNGHESFVEIVNSVKSGISKMPEYPDWKTCDYMRVRDCLGGLRAEYCRDTNRTTVTK